MTHTTTASSFDCGSVTQPASSLCCWGLFDPLVRHEGAGRVPTAPACPKPLAACFARLTRPLDLQEVVIDARAHMLGRLASVVAKQALAGHHVVRALPASSAAFAARQW